MTSLSNVSPSFLPFPHDHATHSLPFPVAEAVIEEANIAYHHNIALLALLRPPSRPAPAPVGDSGTPPEPSPVAEKQQLDLQPSVSTYRTTTVVALIAAVCLAHFFIVVGGLTGEKGAAKLEALQQWFASSSSA